MRTQLAHTKYNKYGCLSYNLPLLLRLFVCACLFCNVLATQICTSARAWHHSPQMFSQHLKAFYRRSKDVGIFIHWVLKDTMGFYDGLYDVTTSSLPGRWPRLDTSSLNAPFVKQHATPNTQVIPFYIHSTTKSPAHIGRADRFRHSFPAPVLLNTNSTAFSPTCSNLNSNTDNFPHFVTDRRSRR